jgi:hypothetical protein
MLASPGSLRVTAVAGMEPLGAIAAFGVARNEIGKRSPTRAVFDCQPAPKQKAFDTFVGEPPAVANGGKGVVVAGCATYKKRLQSMNEFLRHLAEDAMPSLLNQLSSENSEGKQ